MSTATAPEDLKVSVTVMPSRKLIPLSEIVADEKLQIRVSVNEQTIKDYRAILRESVHMDPIVVFREGEGPFLLSDGFQRLQAYREEDRQAIPAIIERGDRSDALKYAIRKNCRHGIQVTNADKRKAADMAVLDPKLSELSDNQLAKLIGVSITLIGDARRGEKPQAKRERHEKIKEKKRGAASKVPVASYERRKPGDSRPRKSDCLLQIKDWVDDEIISESEVVKLFATKKGFWKWTARE